MKLGVVQSKPRKGDIPSNMAALGEVFAQLAAEETPYEMIVLPEAALTGYFLEGAVYELAFEREKLAREIARLWRSRSGAATSTAACTEPPSVTSVWQKAARSPSRLVTTSAR